MAKKSEPKKELAIAPTPIIERYRPLYTWKEFVLKFVPADKYPRMQETYLK
jgi:hypothetical protein